MVHSRQGRLSSGAASPARHPDHGRGPGQGEMATGTVRGGSAGDTTKSALVEDLERILDPEAVLWRPYDLMLYEYDGSIDKARAQAVVFPMSAEQVSAVIK